MAFARRWVETAKQAAWLRESLQVAGWWLQVVHPPLGFTPHSPTGPVEHRLLESWVRLAKAGFCMEFGITANHAKNAKGGHVG
jgi:hypothetical protein